VVRIGIDYDDTTNLHPQAATVDLYFKLQHRISGYDSTHIVPGGYVSPKRALYRLADRWRSLRSRPCRYDVYGRLGLRDNAELRAWILQRMASQTKVSFGGGARARPWAEYMDDLARSAVALDVAGRGPLCYRLVEALAVGSCVVGPALGATLPVALGTARVDANPEDLVSTCAALVGDPVRRTAVSESAAAYFDRYLRPHQLGAYYLSECFRRLETSSSSNRTYAAALVDHE
jgi:hypothetical protein